MTNRNTTKHALLTSIVALFLCFTMLLGTTFAWFTDSVTSANNIIVAGNLDVELYNGLDDTAPAVNESTKLFEEVALWEPGAVAYENLAVANKGNLALKYQLAINVSDATSTAEGKTLADVLKVAVIPGGFTGNREDAKALSYNYSLSTFAKVGELSVGADPDVYGIVIYWEPTANDNDYNMNAGQNPLEITLGVSLFATQLSAELEKDSFDNLYDAGIELPNVASSAANVKADGSAKMEADVAPSAISKKTTIDAPAGAFDSADMVEVKVETANNLFNISADGGVVASLDIKFTVNGEASSADLNDGKVFTVTTYISKGLANVSVDYKGTDGKDEPTLVSYLPETGKLVFTTNHFSNYDVNGTGLAYDAENDVAITTLEQIVEARKDENKQILIPEVNLEAIEKEIENLPEEDKKDALAAISSAQIGENYYSSFDKAFEAAVDGDTITLINNDITGFEVTLNKAITLDLGGRTINEAYIKTSANVTIKNGSIKNVSEPYPIVVGSGTLTVESVDIEASLSDRAIWLNGSNAVLNFNSGSILATKGENNTKSKIYGVWVSTGATANINGGTIEVDAGADATAVAIFGNYVNTVNVTGGKISTSGKNYSYGIYTNGDVTVEGGEIVTNEKRYGYTSGITYGNNYAIYTNGDVTISGGKITTNGYSGYLVSGGKSDQKVTISNVEFANVLTDIDKTTGGHKAPRLIDGNSVNVEITGGSFKGVSAELTKNADTATVLGGTFDAVINSGFLAEGYTLNDNGDGTWTVTK